MSGFQKTKLFLHLGMPKTGSTAIQESMRRYFNDPNGVALYYPEDDVARVVVNSSSGNIEGIANICTGEWPIDDYRSKESFLRFEKNLENAKCNLFFSSETFFSAHPLRKDIVDLFLSKIDQSKFELIYIIYVRDFLELAISTWLQGVKRHSSCFVELDDYVSNFRSRLGEIFRVFNINPYQENVFLLNYDIEKKDLWTSLMKRIEIDDYPNYEENKVVNRSLTYSEFLVMKQISEVLGRAGVLGSIISEEKTNLMSKFEKHPAQAWRPIAGSLAVEKLIQNNRVDLELVSDYFGYSFFPVMKTENQGFENNQFNADIVLDIVTALAEKTLAAGRPRNPMHPDYAAQFSYLGYKERVVDRYLFGWVYCVENPDSSILIEVQTRNGKYSGIANMYRPDVPISGVAGPAYCGFIVELFDDAEAHDIPHVLDVQVTVMGAKFELPGIHKE